MRPLDLRWIRVRIGTASGAPEVSGNGIRGDAPDSPSSISIILPPIATRLWSQMPSGSANMALWHRL